jgi:hypothetical protein
LIVVLLLGYAYIEIFISYANEVQFRVLLNYLSGVYKFHVRILEVIFYDYTDEHAHFISFNLLLNHKLSRFIKQGHGLWVATFLWTLCNQFMLLHDFHAFTTQLIISLPSC